MPKGQKGWVWAIVAAFLAVVVFLFDCTFFHFPLRTGFDALLIAELILIPGFVFSNILHRQFHIELSPTEGFSLSSALGFGFASIIAQVFHTIEWPVIAIYAALIIYLIAVFFSKKSSHLHIVSSDVAKPLALFLLFTLIFFAAYNLQCFHYAADGAIVTRSLFGVDIPWLAGEIHGIRDFGTLRDLHQSAEAWNYHDWTYQLLALLPRERTLPDLAFASPLVSYALLAFSIFAVVFRFTKNRYISYFSVAGWFLISGLGGGELGSYALSPSFVFGSIILLNVILLFDVLLKETWAKQRWIVSATLVFLLFELSRTKLSSFVVLVLAFGIAGLILLRRDRDSGIHILIISAISLEIYNFTSSALNPLMPTSDFLIGAPLMGYANHIAAILHLPVQSLNPVSKGFQIHWQSILIIPFFIFHFLRFAVLDPKLLCALIIFFTFRKYLWKEYGEIIWLIIILIPLGFLMPVLYSPAWYPLALSFYAPLVSEQAALFLVMLGFGLLHKVQVSSFQRIALGTSAMILLAGFALTGHSIAKDDHAKADIVSVPLQQAMDYLSKAAGDQDRIASRKYDIDSIGDESYYWYSALSGRAVVSEGAKYGSLLGAVADTDSEKGLHPVLQAKLVLKKHRRLLDVIYSWSDSSTSHALIEYARVSFILEDSANKLSIPSSEIGTEVFNNGQYRILKVREYDKYK